MVVIVIFISSSGNVRQFSVMGIYGLLAGVLHILGTTLTSFSRILQI